MEDDDVNSRNQRTTRSRTSSMNDDQSDGNVLVNSVVYKNTRRERGLFDAADDLRNPTITVKRRRTQISYTGELKNFPFSQPQLSSSSSSLAKEKDKDYYTPQHFSQGDLVWAKCSKRSPAWPAIVIDPLCQAPQAVLKARVPKTICVMFYGYNNKGKRVITLSLPLITQPTCYAFHLYVIFLICHLQDYGWIKDGMIFPFAEYMNRSVTTFFGY